MADKVSVIVPVYNTRNYLRKCIDSILGQTHRNLELILVDDGSTDGSGDICDAYAARDSRVRVIHQANTGQGIARNAALDVASGDYLAFVDSDDSILPDMYSTMLEAVKGESADMAVCGVINDHVFARKECPGMVQQQVYTKEELFISFLQEPYVREILCNKLYRAELFRSIRFSGLRAREDAEQIYRVFGRCEKTVYVPRSLYVQLIRPGSTEAGAYNRDKLYTIRIFENMADDIRENLPGIARYTELLRAKAIHNAMLDILTAPNHRQWQDTYQSLLAELRQELERHIRHDPVNDELYAQLRWEVENQRKFLARMQRMRLKSRLMTAAKIVLLRLPIFQNR